MSHMIAPPIKGVYDVNVCYSQWIKKREYAPMIEYTYGKCNQK